MHDPTSTIRLIRSADLSPAERRATERAAHRGVLERIRSGVFILAGAADHLAPDDRHRLLVRASLPRIPSGCLISHRSAAVLHRLPLIGTTSPKVHIADPAAARTVVTAWFVRHGVAHRVPTHGTTFAAVPVMSLCRTVVDLAAAESLDHAVPLVDHALRRRLCTIDDLFHETSTLRTAATKARAAIAFGSALSESPAESVCRVRFAQLGAPAPVQQHEFHRPGERPARVDFWFPDQGVVVEVDGRAKYEIDGDPAAAHWREKRREDFIRSFPDVRTVVRFTWADLMDPERIRAALRRAGVPCR